MEHWRNDTDTGKEKHSVENIYYTVSLSINNVTQTDLGSNPNLRAPSFVYTYTSFYSAPEGWVYSDVFAVFFNFPRVNVGVLSQNSLRQLPPIFKAIRCSQGPSISTICNLYN